MYTEKEIYFAYKGLDISNFLIGGAIFGIGLLVSYLFTVLFGIQFIDGVGQVLLQVNFWIGIGISLANYLIQRSVGKRVFQRIWEQRWEARVDKIINWFKVWSA
ncbi:hypothetical protein [Cytobacillus firmus]|uniref:hypothetical protein n=1 Tax=Cytobacillus firmus TaxID=1399 RepID=UPI001C8DCF82|nr:hypothetical protein [Cytobacillus firmus]MBX9976416.1 hypothetical protein [Cytobacillus firmus]